MKRRSNSRNATRRRRGIALLTTLVVVLLLVIMTTAVLHLGLGDARRGNDHRALTLAGAATDAGVYSLLRDWERFDFDSMAVGDTLPTTVVPAGDATAVVRGRRTSLVTWWVTALGYWPDSVSSGRTSGRSNLVLRQAIAELTTSAAFTARDTVTVSGTGVVAGADTAVGAWGLGCASGAGVAGIASADTGMVRHGNVSGAPALEQDPAAGLFTTYGAFGPESWTALTGRARVVLPGASVVTPMPRLTGTSCDATDPFNWGEPLGVGPCARHAPVVWVRGDLEIRGGRGQGVLLIDGDVTISQGATFLGVIIARDDVRSGIGGGDVFGAVLAADSLALPGDHSVIDDGLHIRRSGCAVGGVLRRNARLVPVVRRSWAPMP